MSNPDTWKESAVMIYVVATIIVIAIFLCGILYTCSSQENFKEWLIKRLCCFYDPFGNVYDNIREEETEELMSETQISKNAFSINDDDEEEIEIPLSDDEDIENNKRKVQMTILEPYNDNDAI